MSKNLSKEDIDAIYMKYFHTVDFMCKNVSSSNIIILIEQYLQQLVFCLFAFPILIKNGLVLDSNNKKINLIDYIKLFEESKDVRKDFYQLFDAFRIGSTKKEFIINNHILRLIIDQKYELINSKISYKKVSTLDANWISFLEFYLKVLEEFDEKLIEVYSTIYERGLDQLTKESGERRRKGVYYTPPEVTSYINEMTIFCFISKIAKIKIKNLADLQKLGNKERLIEIHKNLSVINILDPACGSGDFIIHSAQLLNDIFLILNEKLQQNKTQFEIKKWIIENNLFGVDLIQESISFTKARLFLWCINEVKNPSEITNLSDNLSYNLETGNSLIGWGNEEIEIINDAEAIDHNFLLLINKQLKDDSISIDEFKSVSPFHWKVKFKQVLERGGFDIIIGNPPYIEIKKFKNQIEKKIFSKMYSSAYKLYDISILFIERGFQLLKENGFFSFILTNKLVSNDSSERIRKLLLAKTKFKSIIDVSYIPVFKEAATYPIIITFQKNSMKPETSNLENTFDVIPRLQELFELTQTKKVVRLSQQDFYDLPKHRFELTGNIERINEMRTASKHQLGDLGTFSYRLLGFTDWINALDNVKEEKMTDKDMKFIGTTNIQRFSINHPKPLTVAKKRITSMYLQYQTNYEKAWSIFIKPKLMVKEVAKFLTVSYDPGLFANATGMYSFTVESKINLKVILLILNSKIMDEYFSSLYSGTHLAGGYFRYNGSYLKELPIVYLDKKDHNEFLVKLADYLLFLNQIQIDCQIFYEKHKTEILTIIDYLESLSNKLIENLYYDSQSFQKLVNKIKESFIVIQFDNWIKVVINSNTLTEKNQKLTDEIYQKICSTYSTIQKLV